MVLTRSFFTKRGPQNIGSKMHLKTYNSIGGSILLQRGGPGVGSSYSSLENRQETVGAGLKNLVNLRNLEMKLPSMSSTKPKNIAF